LACKSIVGGGRFLLRGGRSVGGSGFSSAMAASYSIRATISPQCPRR